MKICPESVFPLPFAFSVIPVKGLSEKGSLPISTYISGPLFRTFSPCDWIQPFEIRLTNHDFGNARRQTPLS